MGSRTGGGAHRTKAYFPYLEAHLLSRVLFLGFPLFAHSIQTFPLVKELVAGGEKVLYYSSRRFENQIKRTGARFREYPKVTSSASREIVLNPHLLAKMTREILLHEAEAMAEFSPDYMIYDRTALWGPFLKKRWMIPAICTHSSIVMDKAVFRMQPTFQRLKTYLRKVHLLPNLISSFRAMLMMRQMAKTYNLQGTIDPPQNADLILVNTSRQFQPPLEADDERYKFVGWFPTQEFRFGNPSLKPQAIQAEKLVYVSLGTTFNKNKLFFQQCFQAFKHLDAQILISTGRGVNLQELGTPPENFTLAEWVPQLEVLERASVFITQGGSSSICESLYFGVPVVVIPQWAEQYALGYWVEKLNIGLQMENGVVTTRKLKEAVEVILSDQQFRNNCKELGDSLRKAGGVQRAIDEIIAFKEKQGIH